MKILYISNAILPSEVSHSLSIMRVCQAFTDAGHEVLLTGIRNEKISDNPVSYYGLSGGFDIELETLPGWTDNSLVNKSLIRGFVHGRRLTKIIKKFEPDIIYSRLTTGEMAFIPRDIPLMYETHSLGPFVRTWGRSYVFKWIIQRKNLKRIIVTTDVLKDWIQNILPNTELVVARLSAESPVEIDADELCKFKTDNLKGDFTHNIGYTGYLDTEGLRGTDVICQMASKMQNVGVHIIGGKPEIVEHWKNYAKDWGLDKNLFFYGYRNSTEIPYFLNLFDVALAPLQLKPNKRAPLGQNMSPLKLPQYMGYKKAIVASDLHSHREVLTDGGNALLVPHNDVDAWVEATQQFLYSPEKAQKFGENAYAAYCMDFTPEGRIKKILNDL